MGLKHKNNGGPDKIMADQNLTIMKHQATMSGLVSYVNINVALKLKSKKYVAVLCICKVCYIDS